MALAIDIRGVLDALGSQRTVSGELPVGSLRLGDETFTFDAPAAFDVTLTNTGAGIVAAGEVRAIAQAQCVRCLCGFDLEVTGDVEGFYVEPGRDDEIPAEQEFEHIRDGGIDLEPALLQALVVDLPFAPLHDEQCAGICPECGADLNEGECGCEVAPSGSPFAKLKDLLDDDAGDP